jgi:hypothetical protein
VPRNSPAPATTWTAWAAGSTLTGKPSPPGSSRSRRPARSGPYLRYIVSAAAATTGGTSSDRPGKPALTWWFDQDAIDAEAATDGWYALLTNADASITATDVLLRYKGQEAVERRYGNLKGPLAVAPMFLHSNRRIAALITVISLALLSSA